MMKYNLNEMAETACNVGLTLKYLIKSSEIDMNEFSSHVVSRHDIDPEDCEGEGIMLHDHLELQFFLTNPTHPVLCFYMKGSETVDEYCDPVNMSEVLIKLNAVLLKHYENRVNVLKEAA